MSLKITVSSAQLLEILVGNTNLHIAHIGFLNHNKQEGNADVQKITHLITETE